MILGMSAPTDPAIQQSSTSVFDSKDGDLLSRVPVDSLREEDGAGEESDHRASDRQIPN